VGVAQPPEPGGEGPRRGPGGAPPDRNRDNRGIAAPPPARGGGGGGHGMIMGHGRGERERERGEAGRPAGAMDS
jgi:hypothetical protein